MDMGKVEMGWVKRRIRAERQRGKEGEVTNTWTRILTKLEKEKKRMSKGATDEEKGDFGNT